MLKIKYRIERLGKHLFGVLVPDDYDRSMLFLRPQEYVESPCDKFRGKSWDVWTFVKWYSKQQKDPNSGFTYAKDYAGFNFALTDALECYLKLPPDYVTSYDEVFIEVLQSILRQLESDSDIEKTYIIGYEKRGSWTMRHELRHAAYFLDDEYHKVSNELIASLPRATHSRLVKNLYVMGYHSSTVPTELQAYLASADWKDPDLGKGIDKDTLRRVHTKFNAALEKPLRDFSSHLRLQVGGQKNDNP